MTDKCFEDDDFSLLRLAPQVLRARDYRLYTKGGRRLVDLWQNGGAAILGHTPPSVLREIKNTASRGLYAPFPHFLEARFFNALSRIFPGRNFRLYAAPPPELETLVAGGTAALWRPFLDPESPLSVPANAPPVLIPVVPGISGWRGGLPLGLCVLAIDSNFKKMYNTTEYVLCPNDCISPVLLAAVIRGLYDLIAASSQRAKPLYPRVERALKNTSGQILWQRQGLYLTTRQKPSQQEWAALFCRFLENGFLLPPVLSQPVILPGILSRGEEVKLAELLVT
jgi:hypothetical protein